MSLITDFGIYPQQLKYVETVVEEVCEKYGMNSESDVWEYVREDMEDYGVCIGDERGVSNVISQCAFENLKSALVESRKVNKEDIDFYVNGTLDTTFYICGEQI